MTEQSFLKYRISVVEAWPESETRTLTLRGIQQRIEVLETERRIAHSAKSSGIAR